MTTEEKIRSLLNPRLREIHDTTGGILNMGDIAVYVGQPMSDAMTELAEFIEKRDRQEPIPIFTTQLIIDAGLNAFALQLFAESVAGKTNSKTFRPFAFIFRNIKITLEPQGEVDTTHH